jgi:allantoinase
VLQQTSSFCSGLSLFWTEAKKRSFSIADVSHFLSYNPSKLCGLLDSKGQIKEGMDADLVIWDPEAKFQVCTIIMLNISNAYV